MPIFSAYHEIVSPTTVESAVWATLLPNEPAYLVLLRKTVLDIYAVGSAESVGSASEPRAQLRLISTTALAEPVADLRAIPLRGRAARAAGAPAGVSVLAMTLRDARVSVVGLDPATLRLRTLALVNLEVGGVGAGAGAARARAPRAVPCSALALSCALRVDPGGRALAFQPYDDQLCVIPFAGDDALDAWVGTAEDDDVGVSAGGGDGGEEAGGGADDDGSAEAKKLTRAILDPPYVIDLSSIGNSLDGAGFGGGFGVTDMAFLCDRGGAAGGHAGAPAIALLLHPRMSSAARASSLSYTGVLVVLSLNAGKDSNLILWQRDGLPSDVSHRLGAHERATRVCVLVRVCSFACGRD
jgi:hypothetical protein